MIAETVRGNATDAAVNRVLEAVGDIDAVFGTTARSAGALLGRARSTSTVDALIVAATIERGGGVILTGDPDDLRPLAAHNPEVVIRPV